MFNSQSKTTGKAKALGAVSQEQEKTQFMDTDPEMTGKDGLTIPFFLAVEINNMKMRKQMKVQNQLLSKESKHQNRAKSITI